MKILSCTSISIIVALILTSCGTEETATPDQATPTGKSMVATEKLFIQAAEQLVGQYSSALKSELMVALDNYGAVEAIKVCSRQAQVLAASHSAEGWQIKRVSRKWRNILDRPDTVEVAMLEMFDNPATKDEYLTCWSGPDTARVFHYYKKIVVKNICLQCHGDLQTFDLDLYKRIKIAYPYDKATGYQAGNLRGMYVVSVEYPAGEDMAKLLADGVNIVEFTQPDTTAGDTVAGDSVTGDTSP